jgi:hypothetical protein
VNNHRSDGNGTYAYFYFNNQNLNPVGGSIVFNNCSTDRSGFGGAYGRYCDRGAIVTFNNLVVSNPNQKGSDPHYGMNAAIGVGIDGGSASPTFGGVNFKNVAITGGNNAMQMDGASNSSVSGTWNGKPISYP